MSSSATKPSTKASKSPSRHQSSLSSHLAMLDLKSRILSSLSKLSDRDTYQIAVDDLESIIASLPADGFSMFLSSLLHDPVPSPGDASGARSSPIVARRESIRLLALLCAAYPDSAAAHLPKIITLIVRRLKDPASDTSLRDACGDAVGSLAAIYLRSNAEESGGGRAATAPVAGLFLKPLLEVMGEQSKTAQTGAAMCLGKVVEGGGGGAVAFQRLCPRICKMIGTQSFLAKGSLLSVLSKLAQIGAISSQSMPVVLQSVRECLENNDWATRKAAADTLSVLASQASHLIADGASQTIASLEACRFDKVKPVRDSIMAALQLWKKILEKGGNGTPERLKAVVSGEAELKLDSKDLSLNSERPESVKDSSADSSSTSSVPPSHGKCTTLPENTADLLKIKAPSLKDKELNPEFFQKLESRNSDDVPVEVVVPRKRPQSSHSKDGVEKGSADGDPSGASGHDVVGGCELNENLERPYHRYDATERRLGAHGRQQNSDFFARDKWAEQLRFRDSKLRAFDAANRVEFDPGGSSAGYSSISRTDGLFESSFMNNKVNWLGIQRQLSHLERQQAYLMNILQDFMGGSHDSFQTLEDRVHGLERIVDEMARDLLESSGRRGGNMIMGFKGSPGRSLASTVDFKTTTSKFGRGGESRIPYPERYLSADAMASVSRGREYQRPDSEEYNSYAHTAQRNGILSCRRGLVASSALRNEHGGDQVSGRRAWDKGDGPFRLGEGPSARSVWQASKDEATLEAIRVAGEDNETFRGAATRRRPIPEVDFETMADGNAGQEGEPVWASWTRAIDSIHIGDADSAYAEVLSTGEDVLLVKLMERSGPVINELSSEVANEILQAVGQLLLEQSLFDITFAWIQQLMNLVMENGADFLSIPVEVKREILLNLHQVSTMELQEDSYGALANQLLVQLASAWGINIQHLVK